MPKKLLIVDDAESMRGLISITLKSNGYEVIEASNGRDALTKMSGQKIDMIISDLNMPIMDGIEFIIQVKANAATKMIPIVMLTTESDQEKKEKGKQAGAKAWMVKPFKPEMLVDVVKKVIG